MRALPIVETIVLLTLCKSKLHRATVTQAELHYEGSITIDAELLDAAGIVPFERVQVVNIARDRITVDQASDAEFLADG